MEDSLKVVYMICATAGGTVLVIQTVLLMMGVGADADADADVDPGDIHDVPHDAGHGHDHAGEGFLKVLSFKTLVAFVTFFGLSGLASQKSGLGAAPTLVIALCAGSLALYLVAYLMAALSRLQSKGNLDLKNAVGETAKVYLRVPGERSGQGKVIVAVQGRRVECKAVTAGPEIPTGAEVQVVGTSTPDTLEVLVAERKGA
ncbi:MAG: hypothetical protein HY721_01425 [Planctomycetes bacterium]|nr:hypothetical protein [Planctomycetota bacterium]